MPTEIAPRRRGNRETEPLPTSEQLEVTTPQSSTLDVLLDFLSSMMPAKQRQEFMQGFDEGIEVLDFMHFDNDRDQLTLSETTLYELLRKGADYYTNYLYQTGKPRGNFDLIDFIQNPNTDHGAQFIKGITSTANLSDQGTADYLSGYKQGPLRNGIGLHLIIHEMEEKKRVASTPVPMQLIPNLPLQIAV